MFSCVDTPPVCLSCLLPLSVLFDFIRLFLSGDARLKRQQLEAASSQLYTRLKGARIAEVIMFDPEVRVRGTHVVEQIDIVVLHCVINFTVFIHSHSQCVLGLLHRFCLWTCHMVSSTSEDKLKT